MFPTARLPDIFVRLPDPGQPVPALHEEVVVGLLLSPLAPPESVIIGLADLDLQIGPGGGVSGQQLVIASSH